MCMDAVTERFIFASVGRGRVSGGKGPSLLSSKRFELDPQRSMVAAWSSSSLPVVVDVGFGVGHVVVVVVVVVAAAVSVAASAAVVDVAFGTFGTTFMYITYFVVPVAVAADLATAAVVALFTSRPALRSSLCPTPALTADFDRQRTRHVPRLLCRWVLISQLWVSH